MPTLRKKVNGNSTTRRSFFHRIFDGIEILSKLKPNYELYFHHEKCDRSLIINTSNSLRAIEQVQEQVKSLMETCAKVGSQRQNLEDVHSTMNALVAPMDFDAAEVNARINAARMAVDAVEAANAKLAQRVSETMAAREAQDANSSTQNAPQPPPQTQALVPVAPTTVPTPVVSAPQSDARQITLTTPPTASQTVNQVNTRPTMSQMAAEDWQVAGPKKKNNKNKKSRSSLQRGEAVVNRDALPTLPVVEEPPRRVGSKVVLKPNFTTEHLKEYAQYDATLKNYFPKLVFEEMHVKNNEQHLRVICEDWNSKNEKGSFWDTKFWPDFCQVDKWRGELNRGAWKPYEQPKGHFTILAEGLHTSATTQDVFRHVDNLYNHDEDVEVLVRQRPVTPNGIRYQTTSFVIRVRSVDRHSGK